jgi:putative ABC transport system substrate-binding protein
MTSTRRRLVGSALALFALAATAPRIASAQARTVRIGVLAPRQNSIYLPAVLKRLGELGYVEGKNLIVDFRSADGVAERFPSLARDLIRAKNDLIIALGSEHSARALLAAKADVPVVILATEYDPVKAGFVSSLRRPGGNVTGMVLLQPEIATKRLQVVREIVPKAKRILALADRFSTEQLEAVRQAAERLSVEIVVEIFASLPYDLESAFAKGRAARVGAVVAAASPAILDHRTRIAELALKQRLPSVGGNALYTEAGFLISYGVNPAKAFIRAGDIAASILKGAKPGDIPVEQPTEFEFVVNLKTAKALGISIPQSILLRANRVIE